jgi:L-ascorbate metabolism protein UlaG (beta-lactamase superfamily)
MKRFLAFLAILAVVAVGRFAYRLNDRPSMEPYRALALEAAEPEAGKLRATFLGVATLLFDDGETAILVDGFFSRPSVFRTLATRITPDIGVIARSLERAGIRELAAVITVHSHYDHAMDSPDVARRTGALLVGSESTANIGRGAGLAEDSIHVVKDGDRMTFGKFAVTAIRTAHFPHGMAMGEITAPLVPPARATAYLEGGNYSYLIEHGGRRLLVQGSAGFRPGALRGRDAEVVFLGITGLGGREDEYRDSYWREVVDAVDAKRVIPIHWDDFTLPLDRPLEAMPRLLDDIPLTMSFLLERAKDRGVDVRFAPEWQRVDPFSGLALER